MDALIDRLRERAADPERQVDARDSQFYPQVKSLDLGGLVGMLGELRPLFGRALDLSRSGSVDPDVLAKAEELATGMSTPVDVVLPQPAALEDLERLEASLGVAFRHGFGASTSRSRTEASAPATIARMTPEERAAMGLPEVGWESVVWGGIGFEETDSASEDT